MSHQAAPPGQSSGGGRATPRSAVVAVVRTAGVVRAYHRSVSSETMRVPQLSGSRARGSAGAIATPSRAMSRPRVDSVHEAICSRVDRPLAGGFAGRGMWRRREVTVISRLLFGFRGSRTTLVSGGLWLLCGWALLGRWVGSRSELPDSIGSLADLVESTGPVGVALVAAVGAYFAGVAFELVLGPLTTGPIAFVTRWIGDRVPSIRSQTRAIEAQKAGVIADYRTLVQGMVSTFGKPDDVLLEKAAEVYEIEGTRFEGGLTARRKLAVGISAIEAAEKVIEEAVDAVLSMSHVSNLVPRDEPELSVALEQLEDEVRLREATGWPLIALGAVVIVDSRSAWKALGGLLVLVGCLFILVDAPRRRLHLRARIASALRSERIRPPALTTLIKLLDLEKTRLHERQERARKAGRET